MPQPSRREALVHLGATAVVGASGSLVGAARPSKERIRIGQIGVGHAHATKLAVYRDSPDYEVVGVVESDTELRKQAEKVPTYQGVKWLTRDELLKTPGLQVVLVETRVRDLLDNAEACVAAGMHVHIDKPAGESFPQFQRILET